MDDQEYKSVLIVNDSPDAHVTLYLFHRNDPICWMSSKSIIIKPGGKYLHRSKKRFKFKLVAKFEDKRAKKKLLEVQQWNEDKLFKVTGQSETQTPALIEDTLAHYPEEKRICLRKIHRDKELKRTSKGRNLYEILGLDMDKIRGIESKEKQAEELKKGFRTQIRRWHPDRNRGDEEVAKEILFAYEILQDEEKRSRYNNLVDYEGGWLSLKRYKAIFWPECVTEEQTSAYRKRMALFAVSALITVAGIGLTVFTAGLAAPALVATGAAFGGGLIGGGFQSLQHTLNENSVVDECRLKDWLMKAGIGFVGGAVTGGAAAGITAAVTGIGGAAMESAAITAGQYMGIGAATGATGGVAASLSSDAGRKFVDGENVTWKQVIGRATCGALVGAAAGLAGGAVTKTIVGAQSSAATATLEGEIGEQIVIITGARRLGNALARQVPRMLTENGTEAVMGSVPQFAEERLDDSVENRSPGEHVVNGLKNMAANGALGFARECGGAVLSHAWNEGKVDRRLKRELKNPSIDDEGKTTRSKPISRSRVRYTLLKEDKEDLHKWQEGKCSATYEPLVNEEPHSPVADNLSTIFEDAPNDEQEAGEQWPDGKVKYISEGDWISKMIVNFSHNGERVTEEVRGSGKSIDIPSSARNVEVRFRVRRPLWGDIVKYDRFQKCWCKPYEPHVFRFDTPPVRTFTISGNLWWEAVMRVSDEYHEETMEI